jgi:hypothetical protein
MCVHSSDGLEFYQIYSSRSALIRIILLYVDHRSTLPYPVLPSPVMTASTDSFRQRSSNRVQVLHAYEARHNDELTIRPGRSCLLIYH